jgi:hypothetical protein
MPMAGYELASASGEKIDALVTRICVAFSSLHQWL